MIVLHTQSTSYIIYQRNEAVQITQFWKNLNQGSVIIFDKWKLVRLIDLIPGLLYEVKSGIQSIKKTNYHWSKIIIEPWSRFFPTVGTFIS